MNAITNNTLLSELTIGQFMELLKTSGHNEECVFGLNGIMELFGCSKPTACKIKKSGKIDAAITQVGKTIRINKRLALELAGRKTGGRKS